MLSAAGFQKILHASGLQFSGGGPMPNSTWSDQVGRAEPDVGGRCALVTDPVMRLRSVWMAVHCYDGETRLEARWIEEAAEPHRS
jgi:hypothetical protein